MSKKAFDKIAEGLREAIAVVRGEKKPAKMRYPLIEGYVRKGGRNVLYEDYKRPSPPPPFRPAGKP